MNRSPCGRLARRRTGSFVISSYGLPAGYRLAQHAHQRPGLVVVLNGQFSTETEGASFEATAGQVLVLPAGAPHLERARAGAQCLLVELDEAMHLDDFQKLVRSPGVWHVGPVRGIGVRLAADLSGADGRDLVLDADATELFLQLQACPEGPWRGGRTSHLVRQVVELLEERWRQPPRMSDLAGELGVSAEHLARTFRNAMGCTIGNFLRRQRLLNAARLLRESSEPLATVAHWAGYADQSHMTRQFRHHLGLTPALYRLRT